VGFEALYPKHDHIATL